MTDFNGLGTAGQTNNTGKAATYPRITGYRSISYLNSDGKQGKYAVFSQSAGSTSSVELDQCQADLAACQAEAAYPISGQVFPRGLS